MKGGNERNSGWKHWPARNNDLRLHWSVRVKTGLASLVTVSLQLLQTSSISSTVVLPFFFFNIYIIFSSLFDLKTLHSTALLSSSVICHLVVSHRQWMNVRWCWCGADGWCVKKAPCTAGVAALETQCTDELVEAISWYENKGTFNFNDPNACYVLPGLWSGGGAKSHLRTSWEGTALYTQNNFFSVYCYY